ncbi:hypothetical protein FACS1894132_10670 [Clostridia bacterium]|nr:hypothetical protein FACS1894132_10670 [Clostridia bacterium]
MKLDNVIFDGDIIQIIVPSEYFDKIKNAKVKVITEENECEKTREKLVDDLLAVASKIDLDDYVWNREKANERGETRAELVARLQKEIPKISTIDWKFNREEANER